LRRAGIIDQDIHLTEPLYRCRIGSFAALSRADIGGNRGHLGGRGGGTDFGLRLGQAFRPARDNGDMPARFSEHLGHGKPKAL